MLVYEAPNNNPDEYSPAYYFIPDPTAAEDLPVAEYQQNVAAVCLGAVAAGRITQWQADKLLWDLAETYGPKILNQTRKIFEKVVTHELEAKTSRWTKLTGAAIRGELTTDVLMPELRRIHSTELGDKGSITWVTSEGLLAEPPDEQLSGLVARSMEDLFELNTAGADPRVLAAIEQLGLNALSIQYEVHDTGNSYRCTAAHDSLGIVDEDGKFDPYITVLKRPEAAQSPTS